MGRALTESEKARVFDEIRQYLADELEIDVEEITASTNIIDDLGGDSIIFLEMIEEFKEKYGINLEVRTIGQYMLKNPVYTVGETVNAILEIIEKGELLVESMPDGQVAVNVSPGFLERREGIVEQPGE